MRLKKLIGLFTAGLMTVMMSVPAVAATTYTPVAGTSCNFNKYLIIGAGDTVPKVTFSFTVAPGAAVSTDTSSNAEMEVLAGVGSPTIADVTFTSQDTATATVGSNIDVARPASERADGLTTGVELEAGEKYATKTATVDFSGVSFHEPGIYRYIITETPSADNAAMGIMNDNDTDRVLDVYVTDNGSGTLVVSAYVLHTDASKVDIGATMGSAGDALTDKTDGFTNEYSSKDLVIKKEVTGNQASRDKYFEFTAKLENVDDSNIYTFSVANDNNPNTTDGDADVTSGRNSATIAANRDKTNPTTVTGEQLKLSETPVTLTPGWNWIGYTPLTTMTLGQALAAANPQVGDCVKSQHGIAFYSLNGWEGSLEVMESGHGYMYNSTASEEKSFVYPNQNTQSNRSSRSNLRVSDEVRVFAPLAVGSYPDNMSMVIALKDGEQSVDTCEVAAYIGGDCRGATRANDGLYYLIIAGEGSGQPLELRTCINGETVVIDNTLTYISDVNIGTPWQPYVIDLSKVLTGISTIAADDDDNDSDWWTLQGFKIGRKPTQPGVYIHHGNKVVIKRVK